MESIITLTVGTQEPEEHYRTYQELSELASNLSASHHYVTVSSIRSDLDETPDDSDCPHEHLTHDDKTLLKVRSALEKALETRADFIPAGLITDMISEMQNAGILFRERS